jgi:hypothetical protein
VVRPVRRWGLVAIAAILLQTSCSPPCQDSLGSYPPPQIVVTGAETVDVPYIAWECPGFNSDSMDPPPSVAPDPAGEVRVEMTLEPGSTVEFRFGNQPVSLDHQPAAGANSWSLRTTVPGEPLITRLCSEDGRCAVYWLNLYTE